MTTRARKAVPAKTAPSAANSDSKAEKLPDGVHAFHVLDGRKIAFSQPTTEQLMVLRRVSRDLDSAVPAARIRAFEKVLNAVSALIISEEDREFADEAVLELRVDIEELVKMIQSVFPAPAEPEGAKMPKAKAVRRVASR